MLFYNSSYLKEWETSNLAALSSLSHSLHRRDCPHTNSIPWTPNTELAHSSRSSYTVVQTAQREVDHFHSLPKLLLFQLGREFLLWEWIEDLSRWTTYSTIKWGTEVTSELYAQDICCSFQGCSQVLGETSRTIWEFWRRWQVSGSLSSFILKS